ncbi:unnamed protein product [Ceutorhynchus assimilis]|uniref:DNA polymerase delta subunit 3 n=1 Tax=Ceutorhynchus assimilis TaxID=467358 RepID=A0A9N9MME8_9CUCU|nr:unnamed protein product [Ceutorhynchus assimilis]
METQFEKLEELIKDDDKIVTVVSLSQIAKVSLQESQNLINKYVELHKESEEIFPTYILSGIKKETGDLLIVQVNNENIEDVKKHYKNDPEVIIFSIQRSKSIDYNVISLVQPKSDNFLLGQVVGKNCVKRILTKKILPTLPAPTIKGKSTIFTKQNSAVNVKSEDKLKPEEDKNNDTKTKQASATKGTIANMFKAAQTQNKKPVEQKPKKNVGLSNFLTKKPIKEKVAEEIKPKQEKAIEDKVVKETKQETEEIKPKPNKSTSDLFDSDTDEEILKDLQILEEKPKAKQEEEKPKAKKTVPKKPTQKNKRKKTEESSGEKATKRRKRIIVEESDSSDDMFADEKSDNEEPPEPMEIEPAPVKEAPPPVPKNKRRKAVKKIYEDDEGFLVTETEYVYETASEDENMPEVKVKPLVEKKSNSEPEISPNKASKAKKGAKKAVAANQTTLMSFFKKK